MYDTFPSRNPASLNPAPSALAFLARLLAAVLLPFLSGCNLERGFIFPGTATHGRADTLVPPSPHYELVSLTTRSGTPAIAQFGAALDHRGRALSPASRPTLIFFYGNGSCLAYTQREFDAFRRLGLNVLIPEYPGYGISPGDSPGEDSFYETADAAYDYLLSRPDIDRARIVAGGWSMGAAVALDLASRRPVSHVFTVSAFTSMHAVAKLVAPWAPTSLLIRSRFDNLAKLPAISAPLLLFHGERDTLVPVAMSATLAAHAKPDQARVITFPGVGHNDIFTLAGPAILNRLRDFLALP
jgi:Dipeptidyl aminopeptidases/acylaminoacyl-peptidases